MRYVHVWGCECGMGVGVVAAGPFRCCWAVKVLQCNFGNQQRPLLSWVGNDTHRVNGRIAGT